MRPGPFARLKAKAEGSVAHSEPPIALRLARESLRLQVLLGSRPEYGFDDEEGRWWLIATADVCGAPTPLLFILEGNFPAEAPSAMMVPIETYAHVPSFAIKNQVATPDGWRCVAAPVPAWRPNDDLMRSIEWLRIWFDAHSPAGVAVPSSHEDQVEG